MIFEIKYGIVYQCTISVLKFINPFCNKPIDHGAAYYGILLYKIILGSVLNSILNIYTRIQKNYAAKETCGDSDIPESWDSDLRRGKSMIFYTMCEFLRPDSKIVDVKIF